MAQQFRIQPALAEDPLPSGSSQITGTPGDPMPSSASMAPVHTCTFTCGLMHINRIEKLKNNEHESSVLTPSFTGA